MEPLIFRFDVEKDNWMYLDMWESNKVYLNDDLALIPCEYDVAHRAYRCIKAHCSNDSFQGDYEYWHEVIIISTLEDFMKNMSECIKEELK